MFKKLILAVLAVTLLFSLATSAMAFEGTLAFQLLYDAEGTPYELDQGLIKLYTEGERIKPEVEPTIIVEDGMMLAKFETDVKPDSVIFIDEAYGLYVTYDFEEWNASAMDYVRFDLTDFPSWSQVTLSFYDEQYDNFLVSYVVKPRNDEVENLTFSGQVIFCPMIDELLLDFTVFQTDEELIHFSDPLATKTVNGESNMGIFPYSGFDLVDHWTGSELTVPCSVVSYEEMQAELAEIYAAATQK